MQQTCPARADSLPISQRGRAAMSEPNAILTFMDEDGQEWMAAAVVGPLIRTIRGQAGPPPQDGPDVLAPDKLINRAFQLKRLTMVDR
jgi:hypothetical protein